MRHSRLLLLVFLSGVAVGGLVSFGTAHWFIAKQVPPGENSADNGQEARSSKPNLGADSGTHGHTKPSAPQELPADQSNALMRALLSKVVNEIVREILDGFEIVEPMEAELLFRAGRISYALSEREKRKVASISICFLGPSSGKGSKKYERIISGTSFVYIRVSSELTSPLALVTVVLTGATAPFVEQHLLRFDPEQRWSEQSFHR